MILSFLGFPFCVAFRRSALSETDLLISPQLALCSALPQVAPFALRAIALPALVVCVSRQEISFSASRKQFLVWDGLISSKKDFLCTQNTCTKSLVQQFLFRRPRILSNRTDEIYTGLFKSGTTPSLQVVLILPCIFPHVKGIYTKTG